MSTLSHLRPTVPASKPFPETAQGPGLPPSEAGIPDSRFKPQPLRSNRLVEWCNEEVDRNGRLWKWLTGILMVASVETGILLGLALVWAADHFGF